MSHSGQRRLSDISRYDFEYEDGDDDQEGDVDIENKYSVEKSEAYCKSYKAHPK